ncbi:hypothetical protein NUW58_g4504 [Xylaria curta]|uniref:Uncharacterized protein n=1 Tax=Xylaria curta TaxID=42375 RepID=A0ACC1P7D6_9PEZI|nr:hypothetical protein NUW58_g4504 [Xylaria curta]
MTSLSQIDVLDRSHSPAPNGHSNLGIPPTNYYHYPGALYPQVVTQPAPVMWDGFDPFDEEEQQRRKKGKELVPVRRVPPPLWAGYPGGYAPGAYKPLEYPHWSALPPSQPAPLPALPLPGGLEYAPRRTGKQVRYDYPPGVGRRHDVPNPESGITVSKEVDGILTPSSGDLTVHLTMDLEEDLENHLDELNRLSRLGRFSLAKEFFNENLQHHIDNPYVLLQYADLLLHQGDFKGVTLLEDDAMYKRDGEQSSSDELQTLRTNFELLQILAKAHTLDTLSGVPTVFEDALNVLIDIAIDEPISSTDIAIFALTIRLTGHPVLNSKWLRYGARALEAFHISPFRLYQTLLRQGRIWDFHDLMSFMPTIEDIKAFTYDIFGKDLIPSLKTMVSNWSDSVHGYDTSTTLGLLSIMTRILLEPIEASEKECIEILKLCLPLAILIVENDPDSLKSRPYLRLLLAKSRFAETASRQAIDSLTNQLQFSPGVFYQADISSLPIYVPLGDENPQWTPMDQPSELKDPVRLVLRSAVELGDLETEVLARRELIRLSHNPRDEFDALCTLQMSRQGDLNGYGLSLASKYLVSITKAEKEDLAISISRLLSKVASTEYWDPAHEWILNMLLYKLEGRSPSMIQRMLERSHADYHSIEESLLREISRKMSALKDWVDLQLASNPTQTRPKDTVLRAGPSWRNGNRHTARRTKGTGVRRPTEQHPKRDQQQGTERSTPLMTGSKPDESVQIHRPAPEGNPLTIKIVDNGQQSTAGQNLPTQSPRSEPVGMHSSVVKMGGDDAAHEAQIRKKLEAEFDKRLEAEKESERERRNEKMAILEGLRQATKPVHILKSVANQGYSEVEAIRKEAVEQAERKARAEAQERADRLRHERRVEESKLEKEIAMAKAEMNAAELEAKFEAARAMAMEEAEKKMREEFELRKKKEDEARQQAEHEVRKRIEAEKRAYEEAKIAEELKKQLQQKAEAEKREKLEAEERALDAAKKQAEEKENQDRIRQWAAERAEKDLENQRQIHLKDAVGRKFAIPFSQGCTWQGMKELIEAAFLHVDVIGPEVLAGHYDLIGPDGTIILPQTWDEIIQPGWKISMAMWPMETSNPPQPPGLQTALPAVGHILGPSPPPRRSSDAEIVVESDRQSRRSSGSMYGSSSNYSSNISVWKPSRARRIANAFSSMLKTSIFRRRRAPSVTSSSSSELDD